jgi:hypothetical protein
MYVELSDAEVAVLREAAVDWALSALVDAEDGVLRVADSLALHRIKDAMIALEAFRDIDPAVNHVPPPERDDKSPKATVTIKKVKP